MQFKLIQPRKDQLTFKLQSTKCMKMAGVSYVFMVGCTLQVCRGVLVWKGIASQDPFYTQCFRCSFFLNVLLLDGTHGVSTMNHACCDGLQIHIKVLKIFGIEGAVSGFCKPRRWIAVPYRIIAEYVKKLLPRRSLICHTCFVENRKTYPKVNRQFDAILYCWMKMPIY